MTDPSARVEPDERDLTDLVRTLWSSRRLLALCVLVGVLVTVSLLFLSPDRYTATATILPQEAASPGAGLLGSLAAQSGLSLGTRAGNEEIYGQIVESRSVLLPLISRTWRHRDHAEPELLGAIFGFETEEGADGERRGEHALLTHLRQRVIAFERDMTTGFMALHVTMPGDPELAAEFANALVGVLEAFNDDDRFNRARSQREMIEERLVAVEQDLVTSSAALAAFLEANRAYAASPVLATEYARLEREVSADGLVWQELKRQLELARIDELRNTLTVDVLDAAVPPVRPDKPGLVFVVLVGAILGFVLALLILAAGSVVRSFRAGPGG